MKSSIKCNLKKIALYKVFNAILGRFAIDSSGRTRSASEEVLFTLKNLNVYQFYCSYSIEAGAFNSAAIHSLQFTINKVILRYLMLYLKNVVVIYVVILVLILWII